MVHDYSGVPRRNPAVRHLLVMTVIQFSCSYHGLPSLKLWSIHARGAGNPVRRDADATPTDVVRATAPNFDWTLLSTLASRWND